MKPSELGFGSVCSHPDHEEHDPISMYPDGSIFCVVTFADGTEIAMDPCRNCGAIVLAPPSKAFEIFKTQENGDSP